MTVATVSITMATTSMAAMVVATSMAVGTAVATATEVVTAAATEAAMVEVTAVATDDDGNNPLPLLPKPGLQKTDRTRMRRDDGPLPGTKVLLPEVLRLHSPLCVDRTWDYRRLPKVSAYWRSVSVVSGRAGEGLVGASGASSGGGRVGGVASGGLLAAAGTVGQPPRGPRVRRLFSDPGEALDALAVEARAGGIAQFFLVGGVFGRRGVMCECPVAVWLHQVTGGMFDVDERGASGWDEFWRFPEVVADFIRRFDEGFYPELEIQ